MSNTRSKYFCVTARSKLKHHTVLRKQHQPTALISPPVALVSSSQDATPVRLQNFPEHGAHEHHSAIF
jgi:hypothetical protein